MIVDTAINLPVSLHDSRPTMGCDIFSHITKLPGDYKIASHNAFCFPRDVNGKMATTKFQFCDTVIPDNYDQSLTHLGQ